VNRRSESQPLKFGYTAYSANSQLSYIHAQTGLPEERRPLMIIIMMMMMMMIKLKCQRPFPALVFIPKVCRYYSNTVHMQCDCFQVSVSVVIRWRAFAQQFTARLSSEHLSEVHKRRRHDDDDNRQSARRGWDDDATTTVVYQGTSWWRHDALLARRLQLVVAAHSRLMQTL